ncbi:ABC transporter permease [Methylovirgula sp. 4M-Z18]|uniref:ABC transporter permease n=1 Tax=Methylovirgula sp. 4M-Z18 TaxID=2293567 RepID=UPI000E2F7D30|nr:ABC transporter permease [Methylovirgula sp. 4M-Z18]RFB81347.1 ABC transporter permease [Methylovirgula sp. 4M-Z18]
MSAPIVLPKWADLVLVPVLNVTAAFVISGLVVLAIGENPLEATKILITGSLGDAEGLGMTLYFATNFIFTGLGVALAFRAGLFNIGGEGQAYLAGLGVALVCMHFGNLPPYLLLPLAMIGAAAFGALWAFIPAYLQAKRDSHIVITTIMFNQISAVLMTYLLSHTLRDPTSQQSATAPFGPNAQLPFISDLFGVTTDKLNLAFPIALLAAFGMWVLIWRTRLGYAIRTIGANPTAAVYAGISPPRIILIVMLLSGALCGGVAINEILGRSNFLFLEFPAGAGFVGIAVALMGRAHPVGIVLASILFGMLYQGGEALRFEMPNISSDMVTVIQGLIVLFAALEGLFRWPLARMFASRAFKLRRA